MKKVAIISLSILLLLLIGRLFVMDVIVVPEGKCPQAGKWALVNRWAYGFRTPWNPHQRWAPSPVKRNDWVVYNQPLPTREGQPDTTARRIGRCLSVPGDTLWYNNETGRISKFHDRRNGFTHHLIVPAKGKKTRITTENLRFYAPTIMRHEPVKAVILNDSLCISGRIQSTYTFQQDYYWMTTDNPQNLLDSRSFGFVPQTSLIGKIL